MTGLERTGTEKTGPDCEGPIGTTFKGGHDKDMMVCVHDLFFSVFPPMSLSATTALVFFFFFWGSLNILPCGSYDVYMSYV